MKVVVPVRTFETGDFPEVCALTGEPATTFRRLVVVRRGSFGSANERRRRMFGRGGLHRLVGKVPLSEPAARRTAVVERARAAFAVLAVGGFVAGIFTSLTLLLSSVVLAVLLGLSLYLTVGGELRKTGDEVTLLHVHPRFAEAVGSGER